MTADIKNMQPLGFFETDNAPDWSDNFPNVSNVYPGEKWNEGENKSKYYGDWLINKQISIQVRVSVEGDEDLTIYKYVNGSYQVYDTISPVEITPSGWVSEKVNRYQYTFTEAGVYYIDSTSANYESYRFVVHSELKFRKRLVELTYYNSENDYGMIFFDGETQKYEGLAYFSGKLKPDKPGNDISAFETDRGLLSKQQSTPTRKAKLYLTDIFEWEINRINMIFSCDNITINGKGYQSQEAPDIEEIEDSDLVNITINLTQTDITYSV